jgi:hypothetical protein
MLNAGQSNLSVCVVGRKWIKYRGCMVLDLDAYVPTSPLGPINSGVVQVGVDMQEYKG